MLIHLMIQLYLWQGSRENPILWLSESRQLSRHTTPAFHLPQQRPNDSKGSLLWLVLDSDPTPQPPRALQTLARLALASLAAEKCQDILHLASHPALYFAIGLNKSLIFMVLY